MSKQPNYSHLNTPELIRWCKENGVAFEWKNKAQGHVKIYTESVELYIWVQRMVIEVRKLNGSILSKPNYVRDNRRFDAKVFKSFFAKSIKKQSKYNNPVFVKGVVATLFKEGTSPSDKVKVLREARNLAVYHSRSRI